MTQSGADQGSLQDILFCSGQITGSGEAARETMAGVGVSRPQAQEPQPGSEQLPPPPRLSAEDLHRLQKAQKREKRKLEKQAKKEVCKLLSLSN